MQLPDIPHHHGVNWFVRRCIQVIFPQTCTICKRDIPKALHTPICPLCYSKMSWRNHPAMSPGYPVDSFYSSTEFSGHVREVIHSFKYHGKEYLAPILVDIMTRNWPESVEKFDAIVPVPMSTWREIKRGYNQSYLLARELSKRTQTPLITSWITKKSFGSSQTKLNRAKRLQNAHQQFRVKTRPQIIPNRVLLVDDVCTTGATLRTCATLLKKDGVQFVAAGTVSHEY